MRNGCLHTLKNLSHLADQAFKFASTALLISHDSERIHCIGSYGVITQEVNDHGTPPMYNTLSWGWLLATLHIYNTDGSKYFESGDAMLALLPKCSE